MSIYASLWSIQVPRDGYIAFEPDDYAEVYAQAVPPHIGHPSVYTDGDPYAAFLPPVVQIDREDEPDWQPYRAVVICAPWTTKGTERSGQEYVNPLLVLTGTEYQTITFQDLMGRILEAMAEQGPKHAGWSIP